MSMDMGDMDMGTESIVEATVEVQAAVRKAEVMDTGTEGMVMDMEDTVTDTEDTDMEDTGMEEGIAHLMVEILPVAVRKVTDMETTANAVDTILPRANAL